MGQAVTSLKSALKLRPCISLSHRVRTNAREHKDTAARAVYCSRCSIVRYCGPRFTPPALLRLVSPSNHHHQCAGDVSGNPSWGQGFLSRHPVCKQAGRNPRPRSNISSAVMTLHPKVCTYSTTSNSGYQAVVQDARRVQALKAPLFSRLVSCSAKSRNTWEK